MCSSDLDFRVDILKHLRKIPILQYKEFDPVYMNERTRKDISEVVNIVVNNYMNIFVKSIVFITCLIVVFFASPFCRISSADIQLINCFNRCFGYFLVATTLFSSSFLLSLPHASFMLDSLRRLFPPGKSISST